MVTVTKSLRVEQVVAWLPRYILSPLVQMSFAVAWMTLLVTTTQTQQLKTEHVSMRRVQVVPMLRLVTTILKQQLKMVLAATAHV